MSYFDEVISTRCQIIPRKALSEFAIIERGNGLQKKDFVDNGIGCIHYGQIYTKFNTSVEKVKTFVTPDLARTLKKVNPGDIVMAVTSENVEDVCKCVVWLGQNTIVTGGHAAIIRHSQNPKYLAYWFQTRDFYEQKKKIAHGTKVIEVSPKQLADVIVPLPPKEIQDEIVQILDSFSKLTAELTAELTARKKQYEYYRNKLFSFDEISTEDKETIGLKWVQLGEIGTFTRGRRFVRTDLVEDGIPCIHYGEMYTYYGTKASHVISHIRSDIDTKLRYADTGDVVIVAAGETVEDLGVGVAWLGDKSIAVHDACFIFKHNMNPRYVSHFLRTNQYHSQITPYVSTGKISSISAEGLSKALIPVICEEEQERIVNLLDTFDLYCNDLVEGIPAEIEARKKQYEYYRDKLLSSDR